MDANINPEVSRKCEISVHPKFETHYLVGASQPMAGQKRSATSVDSDVSKRHRIESANEVAKELYESRDKDGFKSFCDVVFVFGEDRVYAHRIVVAIASPVSAKIFGSGKSEIFERFEVSLPEVKKEVCQAALKHLYTRSIDLVDTDNAEDVLRLSIWYELKHLERDVVKFLVEEVSSIKLLYMADSVGSKSLASKAMEQVQSKFFEQDTKEIAKIKLETIVEIVESDKLQVKTERDVVRALVAWLNVQRASGDSIVQQKQKAITLFGFVRLDCIEVGILRRMMKFELSVSDASDPFKLKVQNRILANSRASRLEPHKRGTITHTIAMNGQDVHIEARKFLRKVIRQFDFPSCTIQARIDIWSFQAVCREVENERQIDFSIGGHVLVKLFTLRTLQFTFSASFGTRRNATLSLIVLVCCTILKSLHEMLIFFASEDVHLRMALVPYSSGTAVVSIH